MKKTTLIVLPLAFVSLSGCMFYGTVLVQNYDYGEQRVKFPDDDVFEVSFKGNWSDPAAVGGGRISIQMSKTLRWN